MGILRSRLSWLGMEMLVIAGLLIWCETARALSCENDVINLVTECKKFVVKDGTMLNPTDNCCAVVKKADVPCVCSLITKQIQDLISMEKVFNVAKFCGKDVAPGTKCGSYIVPKA